MLVAERRKYTIKTVEQAKSISSIWIKGMNLQNAIDFGLPEIDDRYHVWRVPVIGKLSKEKIGEVVIDAKTSLILERNSTKQEVLEKRLLGKTLNGEKTKPKGNYVVSSLRNTVGLGDSEQLMANMPAGSVDLVFTSPPYYNARPEYSDYITYEEYLLKLRKIIQQANHVLGEGRFFVMNIAPVLIRRANRNESSKRIAVPFDVHQIFIQEGFEFVDDIIWVKPEGAGWATGRGRRFAADRNALQYKAVPVTEYVLVYRRKSDKLIDWYIRNHPDRRIVAESKISEDYEHTNIWKIKPSHDKNHPAIFPVELARKVIQYYSFKNDVILDPFGGIGTVGEAATSLGRRFVLFDINPEYIEVIRKRIGRWLGRDVRDVHWMNCMPVDYTKYALQKRLDEQWQEAGKVKTLPA
ncbi:site-specific DNA-methyltransferase [Candidatus Woesearchaeota archaeon]|nr:site-specific DNA-methyltransferase [Candidatus Woesearchaeota archaeon]